MILPFREEVVNNEEISCHSFKYPNFVGYLTPNGIPIEFRDKYGYTSHGQAPSLQERFRRYFTLQYEETENLSALEKYRMSPKSLNSEKEHYIKSLENFINSCKSDMDNHYYSEESIKMELAVYTFLLNCYKGDSFFESIGQKITCLGEYNFFKKDYELKNPGSVFSQYSDDLNDFKLNYELYKETILMETFKNILIQYLGYHSIERTKKTISTATLKPYETFYNYILNGFTIYQIPKMIYALEKKKYVQYSLNEFYIPDSELRLKAEIESIKKLTPPNELYKYYR